MGYLGLSHLLMDALQDQHPGRASDSPAEVSRRYPQGGVPDGWNWGTQTRFPQPADVLAREQQIRQLSLAPFAAQAFGKSNAPSSLPDDASIVPLQSARQAGAYAAEPTLWRAGMRLPMAGGRFSPTRRFGQPFPPPPAPSESKNIPMPELPQALKLWWEVMKMYAEFHRKLSLPYGWGESEDADTAVAPIDEVHAKGKPNAKPKAGPPNMQGAPGTVPDADADAEAAAAAEEEARDFCYQRYLKEVKRCQRKFPKDYRCEQNAMMRMAQCKGNNGQPPLDEKEIYDGDD